MEIAVEKRHTLIGGLILIILFSGVWWMSSAGSRSPDWLAREYGIDNAFAHVVETPDGKLEASLVPLQLADGRTAYLVIPQKKGSQQLYLQDESGVRPVSASGRDVSREDFMQSEPLIMESEPAVAPPQAETARAAPAPTTQKRKRSTEKEVLIVAGSAGAGAAIGGVAAGKKGAAVGALSGGVAGLIYDLATRDK
jgi:hypothetical protein